MTTPSGAEAVGPAVVTSVVMPASHAVTFQTTEPDDAVHLTPAEVVTLFAVGPRIPEPDRNGWVRIGELSVDDEVTFLVGATRLDPYLAVEAARRGIEWAISAGVTRAGEDQDHSKPQGRQR